MNGMITLMLLTIINARFIDKVKSAPGNRVLYIYILLSHFYVIDTKEAYINNRSENITAGQSS